MKKVLCLIMALMLVLSFAACSNDAASDEKDAKKATGEVKTKNEVVKDPESVNIEEQVIYDEGDITITAKGLNFDEYWGPEVELFIENNTDLDISVGAKNISVNGLVVGGSFYSDVPAGKKANEALSIYEEDLELSEIELIKEIEFVLSATDSDYEEVFESDPIVIETNADDSYVQKIDDKGVVAVDEDGIKVVVQELAEDDFGDPYVVVYIENNTDGELTFSTENESVNGYAMDVFLYTTVPSGKKAFDTITFYSEDLEENGIDEIKEMELCFSAINWEDWSTYTSPVVSLSFE